MCDPRYIIYYLILTIIFYILEKKGWEEKLTETLVCVLAFILEIAFIIIMFIPCMILAIAGYILYAPFVIVKGIRKLIKRNERENVNE